MIRELGEIDKQCEKTHQKTQTKTKNNKRLEGETIDFVWELKSRCRPTTLVLAKCTTKEEGSQAQGVSNFTVCPQ